MLSVIIATHNRSRDLEKVLKPLLAGGHKTEDYEIIIVDNDSIDSTPAVVYRYRERYPHSIKYIFEENHGKAYALNAGIAEAKGDVVAFTDDDVVIDKVWVKNIRELAGRYDFDAAGGRVLPLYDRYTPNWIRQNQDVLVGPIVSHDYGQENKPCDQAMAPFLGANMVVKRDVFDEFGLFRTDLGPGTGRMGEDTEFYRRLQKAGKKLFYWGELAVQHKVDRRRVALSYIARWNIASGRHLVRKGHPSEEDNLVFYFGIPRYLIRRFLQNVLLLLPSVVRKREFLKRWSSLFSDFGMILEYKFK